jgi:hypothetical protein
MEVPVSTAFSPQRRMRLSLLPNRCYPIRVGALANLAETQRIPRGGAASKAINQGLKTKHAP